MENRILRVDGFDIRYQEAGGAGPVLLCIHGIGGSLELWNRQLEGLSSYCRVIAVDLPGHGLSDLGHQPYDLPDFADVCWCFPDALGIEKVVLAGNSMGGAVALLMAGSAPHRTEKVILAGAASLGRRSPFPFRLMSLPFIGEVMTKPNKAGIQQQLNAIFFEPQAVTDDVQIFVTRNAYKPGGAQAFLSTLRFMTDFGGQRQAMVDRAHRTLAGLEIPVLFVHGREDAVVTVQHSIEAQRLTPNSKLLILEKCGHTPQWEQPAQFNQATVEFLAN